jgi:Acyclic terpene utilisation family protein AtuA
MIRIGNCSGFYGDRFSAMREMLEDGPLDVLTGDYLAELTMLILGRDTLKDTSLGYARTFVRQLEDCLGLAVESGVRIVSNAGGLNPSGLADKVREVSRGLGLDVAVAHVEGDDVRALGEWPEALTANAYLGGFGIAAALEGGADVVVTGRVTDASLVLGAGVAEFGWTPTSYDELAGAVVAGHVLECGAQATGGNFSGFRSLPHTGKALGFPIAELAADGSSVITKHDGTGGAVTVDTVTAQLLYEIQSTRYLGPDVTTLLDTIRLEQEGPDRVAISGVRGEAPPARLKVGINQLGGHRNTVEFVLTGLDIDAKADWVREQMEAALAASGTRPASVTWSRTSVPHPDADTEEAASCLLRCAAKDPSPEPVGKPFTAAAVELALASYPGFTMTAPPSAPTPYGVYRPEYVDRSAVEHVVAHADGRREVIPDPPGLDGLPDVGKRPSPFPAPTDVVTRRLPLGTFVHARSGDKGGDANLGLWVTHEDPDKYDARVTWLSKLITPDRIRDLVPEAEDLDIEVYVLPNLGAVNVLIRGLLGEGVAASTRFDPQAKGLGEWVRSRMVAVEVSLL